MTVVTAILPVLGVIIGALLQHWLSRATETKKQLQNLQCQAYSDYLRAVAASAHGDVRAALLSAAEAKARIAVYGSPAVIAALAHFEEVGPTLNNPRSITCFVTLINAMRSSFGKASPEALRQILFGTDTRLTRPTNS